MVCKVLPGGMQALSGLYVIFGLFFSQKMFAALLKIIWKQSNYSTLSILFHTHYFLGVFVILILFNILYLILLAYYVIEFL